ncbi:MAG TPA: type II CAAX endopeptidase family protein [Gemmataceae bacterium]|nr:type II CAAX endopeptidase family protein [Gemmataceae bacterium]
MEAVRKRAGPVHGVLVFAGLGLVVSGLLPLPWPLYLLLPLLIYAGIVLATPSLRATAPRLAIGQTSGPAIAAAVALSLATAAVLIAFHILVHPDVSGFAVRLPVSGPLTLICIGVFVSVVNALLEELIFRGIMWEVVAAEWNAGAALVVTAGVFGLFHLHGYPSGPLGVVLAGLYGLALGLLRWWTGGLALAIACHVCADATIFSLLVRSGVFTS